MNSSGFNSNRSKRHTGGRWRTCFITAPSHVNLNTIKKLLEERGLKPFVSSELPPTHTSLLEHVTRAIATADFLIAVLDTEQSNANVYYELGYAHALRKRALILVPPELKHLPTDIMEMLHLRADTENREAISFALDQILAAPEPPTRHKSGQFVDKSRPIGHLADELLHKLESLGDGVTERDIEQIVVSVLRASGISVVAHSGQPDICPDVAIWVDELDPWGGNPLLIEMKRHLKSPAAVIHHLSTYLQKSNSRLALVLYVKGPPSVPDVPLASPSSVLFLTVRELLDRLRTISFGEVVHELRNRQIHGGGL